MALLFVVERRVTTKMGQLRWPTLSMASGLAIDEDAMATPLAGKRVLIVEDNWIEKIALEQMIADAGATLIDRLDNSCDLGLLDIWSGNRDAVLPLARALIALRAPFLFYTSSMATEVERLQRAFPGCPIIEKPAPMQEILTELCKALDWKPAAVSEQQSPTRRSPERL